LAAGWLGISLGAAMQRTALVVAGAAVVGVASLILAKTLLELSSTVTALDALRVPNERAIGQANAMLEVVAMRETELAAAVEDNLRSIELLASEMAAIRLESGKVADRLAGLVSEHAVTIAGSSALGRSIDDLRNQLGELVGAHEATRAALASTRALTDKLATRVRGPALEQRRVLANSKTSVDSPILSIAVPSYDRPAALNDLLTSLAREIAACPPGLVEVCITDDASPDPEAFETALMFAEQHDFASLHVQASNVGIERNVLAAGIPCSGEYLLLIGNDDILVPGALSTILADLRTRPAPLYLYSKRRINLDGSPRADIAGSTPIEIAEGDSHLFASFVDAASERGLLSTFGYIGPIVMQRRPFLDVDPDPYLDLTMYAPLCVMIEAFAHEKVFYRNSVTVLHRTPTPGERHAESIGRPAEPFMAGGNQRLSRFFGTSLAAALQRLVDRRALDHETIARMPESLMTKLPLVDWIERNRSIDPSMDSQFSRDVVADADRLFARQSTNSTTGPA
jgi:hypothetical protein